MVVITMDGCSDMHIMYRQHGHRQVYVMYLHTVYTCFGSGDAHGLWESLHGLGPLQIHDSRSCVPCGCGWWRTSIQRPRVFSGGH
jgi:hypothetical protein